MTHTLRNELIDTALAMNASGLNQGASGNLSVRYEQGMLITPSGMDYAGLVPDDIVRMDFDGHVEGKRKPSSEWRFHAAIYQHRPEANAILHAHPLSCSALACLGKSIPAFHYMVAIAGGRDIRCADYATFGSTELSEHVIDALVDRKACLMAHHGLTCFDTDLPRVLALAIEVEHLASVYCRILAMGEAEILDDDEMNRVLEKFKTYGLQDQG
jgi:L-fuculose-phosphate aldolase